MNPIGGEGVYMRVRMMRRMGRPPPFCVHQTVVPIIDEIFGGDPKKTDNPKRYTVPNFRVQCWDTQASNDDWANAFTSFRKKIATAMLKPAKTNVVAVFSSACRLSSFLFLKAMHKTRHIAAAMMISDCHVGWLNHLINAFQNSMPALQNTA